MTMNNLSKSKHTHLIQSLLVLERILDCDSEEEADLIQTCSLKNELELQYQHYELLLIELQEVITVYETLYKELKYQHLLKKLKMLKRTKGIENVNRLGLQTSIQLSYGT